MTKSSLAIKLRGMARFLDEFEGSLFPVGDASPDWYGLRIWLYDYGEGKPSQKETLAQMIRTLKDRVTEPIGKDYQTDHMMTKFEFPTFQLRVYTSRDSVCRKIETGRMVEREVIDYSAAPKTIEMVPETEWVCDPILAD